MPVAWKWYNEQHTIMCYTLQDPWTFDEFVTVHTEASQAVAKLEWVVDAIIDLSQASTVPKNITTGMVSLVKRTHSMRNMGSAVVIYANPFTTTLIQVLQRVILQNRVILAKDFNQAEEIITELQNER